MKLILLSCLTQMSLSLTIPSTEEIHHLRFNPDDYEFLETDVKPTEDRLSEEDQQVCPEINERQVNGGIKPKYELDPNLFITPVYIWGPSSQLQGLREAIGVAIRLNRTLLLPPFLTHQTDSSGGDNPVPVDIRLDIPKLRELLSIGFTDDLQCRQSDVVFLARGIYNKPTDPSVMMERVKRIENFEKATSMKVIRRNEETNDIDEKSPFLERSIPVTRSPKVSGAGVQLSYRSDLVQSLYNSTAQCATWLFPYNTYKYPVVWSAKDSPLTSGEQFFYQIVEHTRKPSYIRAMADKFQEKFLNGPYIAFHYRYDAGEWSSVCARPQQGRKGEVCVVLEKTGSKGLALALTRFILQTNAFISGSGNKKSTIYVASPPTEAQKIKEVLNLAGAIMAGEGWTLDIVTTIDASNFLESEYPSCELMQYKEEVLSLLEQELSYRGDYFIFSELSGWSANVRKERILDDKYFYEMSVIKLIEDFGPFSTNYTTTELYSKAEQNDQTAENSLGGGMRLPSITQN
jgi:hypothetical protein